MKQHAQASALAAAVATRDGTRLGEVLTDTVRLRSLLPGGPMEDHGKAAVLARFRGWFTGMETVDVVEAVGESVADRLWVHYRLSLGKGSTRWACTQTLVCTVDDSGRMARIDLLCSGFREPQEVSDEPARSAAMG